MLVSARENFGTPASTIRFRPYPRKIQSETVLSDTKAIRSELWNVLFWGICKKPQYVADTTERMKPYLSNSPFEVIREAQH